MAVPRRSTRPRYTVALLVLTAVSLLTLDVNGFPPLDAARSGVLTVLAPVGGAASSVFEPVGDAWTGAFDSADLKRENDDLRRQVEELQGQIAQGQAAQGELAELKASVDLPSAGSLARVTAQVTSGAIADFDDTVEIDRGSDDGIVVGMPVVVNSGLVGTVAQTSGNHSVVRLVTDRSFRAGVQVPGSPARGIAEGQGDDGVLKATNFDVAAEVPAGTLLVTAGTAGSRFPPGIPLGTVEGVSIDDATQQKVADVRLATDLDDLLFVTVLLYGAP